MSFGPGNLFGGSGNGLLDTYKDSSYPENVHKMFIMYALICAKMSIFPPKMAQETIQYGKEIARDWAGNVSYSPGVITGI